MQHRSPARQGRQQGAVLIVGLVLLLVLTLLGISGINTAALELNMAGNAQAGQLAFQAAETGIEVAISGPVSTNVQQTYDDVAIGDGTYAFTARMTCAGATSIPDGMYSEGVGARAIHFDIESVGRGPRNARSTHRQSFYIIGPVRANPNFNPDDSIGSC